MSYRDINNQWDRDPEIEPQDREEAMRLHEQLGGEEPDQEVESLLADWRRVSADGADYGLSCPDCDKITSDGEYCGECLSQRAEYYHPDEGGEN